MKQNDQSIRLLHATHTHPRIHVNITLKHTLPFVDLKIKQHHTSMYILYTNIRQATPKSLLRITPNQLQIETSMSQKGNSKVPDFLINQQNATVADLTVRQFIQYCG